MDLLYSSELQDPVDWVGMNAKLILASVMKAGGWAKIFPDGVPRWLHKLRNYFNVEPRSLRLVDRSIKDHWMSEIRAHGKLSGIVGKRTLTGDVYFDEEVEVWYQMGAGGSIYHWGRDVMVASLEAAFTHTFRGQARTPIFKLICPDGTGGSKETIIMNPQTNKIYVQTGTGWPGSRIPVMQGREKIGEINRPELVVNRVVTKMKYQGSYNFSETAVVGLDEHKKRDVKPHEKDPIYIDPPDRFAPLDKRVFSEAVLKAAGAKTTREKRDPMKDLDDPPMRKMRE
ncbi:hypothetical protein [Leptolyngbya sp. 7M]|uniref:hypothetical protein n=1 Tax=Leptolyngbya sp. 7M TaxID=2812896 RepID=UPI001B8BAB8C|nr:hypothetical protein [Leptolyngbya sp. 7M]QYO63408.1 hypothetical protein JVX88_26410 [Leptolyngbya sp. 7M]